MTEDRWRRTRALTQVAITMMEDPTKTFYGYELAIDSDVRAGSLYPILTRMLERGWVTDGWEDKAAANAEKRPPRRHYRLTGEGRAALAEVVAAARTEMEKKRSIFDRLRPELG
jgi:PadR family transcriptional regulator PadR